MAGRSLQRLLQGPLDRLDQASLDHRERLGGRADGDVAGVRPEGCGRRQADRTGHPGRAADDEDGAGRVLRVVGLLPGHERQHLARDQPVLGLAVLEPDVDDDHLSGV